MHVDSPLFRRLYAELPPTAEIELHDLPVTHKPELMAEFDDWLSNHIGQMFAERLSKRVFALMAWETDPRELAEPIRPF
ncbi:hypothetical protein [Ruegeria arenilitoris]|uniref:hypothetical protein n=1 Tax=Ruegeria arenilitoris TaxID=1173585 RepID=UPI00147FF71F|nr:hypothetical protein [Ruegeria arenilitoris]